MDIHDIMHMYIQNKEKVMKYSLAYIITRLAKNVGINFDPTKCPELAEMKKEISKLPNGIQFTISHSPNGEWIAESVNIPGILTGGDAKDDIDAMVKDAIFTYYGVPPQYCDTSLLRNASKPITIKQSVYATA